MAVTGLLNKLQYTGNGVTLNFAFGNTLYTDGALGVTLTDGDGVDIPQVLNTDYTISLAGDFTTATVEMVSAPLGAGGSGPLAEVLTIYRTEPDTQTVDYVEGGPFPADTTEIALDKATLESQTQAEQLKRCIKLPVTLQDASSNAFDGLTNAPTDVKQYFQWNDTTKVFEVVNPISSQADIGGIADDDTIWISDTSDSGKLKKVSVFDLGFATATIPDLITDSFVDGVDYTSGTTTQLTLSGTPGTESNTQIYFDGVYQEKSTYTLAAAVLTFDAAIPTGVSGVDVVFGAFLVTTTVISVNGENGVVVIDADDISDAATTNKFTTAAEITKLGGVEAFAEVNPTNAETKTAYEANADTNVFDNAAQSKLSVISAGAEVNPDVISQAEAEAGTATTERIFTAERVKQAIAALAEVNTLASTSIVGTQNYIELPINTTGVYLCTVFSDSTAGTHMCHINANSITQQSSNDDVTPSSPASFQITGGNIRWGGGALPTIDAVMYLTRIS